jgi:pyrroline-5-carboxylate reductase
MGYKTKLGFIGAGNMAEALSRGVIRAGVLLKEEIIASDVREARRHYFQKEIGVEVTDANADVARSSETILFAVKPQNMAEALEEVGQLFKKDQFIISIAAGISTAFIESHLKEEVAVVRSMPNTPMLIGQGMVAVAPGKWASRAHLAQARKLFESAARVIEVEEELIDAVTAVSGSGPAYFFYLIEAMVEAAVSEGLSPEDALTLASETALGAARLLIETGGAPEELRRNVTSPGGTTEAAIRSMEKDGVKQRIVAAIQAAARRSRELGK